MISLVSLIAVLLLLSATALMSGVSAAARLVSRGRARRLVEAERPGAVALERLQERGARTRGVAGLVSGATYAATAALGTWALIATYPTLPVWAAVGMGMIGGTVIVFALAEALPRTLAVQNPEGVALASARLALPVVRALYPVVRLLSAPWRLGMHLAGGERAAVSPWVSTDEYRGHPSADEEETARDEAEEAILDAVADFTGKVVREVMVPRTDMTSLPDTATVAEAIDVIEECGYSRLPVYHETVDDVQGVLYAKDLLSRVGRGETDVRPADIVRPAVFVPETKPVEELLQEMRATSHIAIVADEYGGTSGLVTIEDLIEEIVGEVFDEYDLQFALIEEAGDGLVRVDARLPVDDLNDHFGTAIETEADTVGGLFTEIAGHIPKAGESVEVEGLRLTVEDLEGTRILHIVVGAHAHGPGQEGHDA